MITANLESLRDRIVSRVPLCPAAFVMAYLRQAASQFFRESEIWRYTFEDIDLVANQATYELVFPAAMATGVELVRIDYAEESGVALALGKYDLDYLAKGAGYSYYLVYEADYIPTESVTISSYAAWSALTTYAVGDTVKYDRSYWASLLAANLNKNPITQTTYWDKTEPTKGLDVYAVLAPTVVAGYVTPRMWNQWSEALLWGTVKAICDSRNRPWYDPVQAAEAKDEYAKFLSLARKEQNQQFSVGGELRAVNSEGWL